MLCNIVEVDVAHLAVSVPLVHRIDSLAQLSTALFVDTARIYPDIGVPVCGSESTHTSNLAGGLILGVLLFLLAKYSSFVVRENDLITTPGV